MMEILVRDSGETTIYRGNWGDKGPTQPLFNFYPGWGLGFDLELPTEWHEDPLAMLRVCLLWGHLTFYFPWYRLYPDHMQCEGPRYGFHIAFIEEGNPTLFLHYGQSDGTPDGSRLKIVYGPWSWGSSVRRDKSDHSETHDYTYTLKSGEVQHRKATIRYVEQEWRRWWLPGRKVWRGIEVDFDGEVGERTGSWKGGTIGCGYELQGDETPLECLRRMERERKF